MNIFRSINFIGFPTAKAFVANFKEYLYATIKGFEVMRALRKGQGRAFNLTRDPIGEKRMIERAFGVGPCVMAEAVAIIEESLAAA